MTIKEVEQMLEVPRATIRFYEKEKLIRPERSGNSYREYSEEDVAALKKIVILRKIGMPVSDIKELLGKKVSLQDMLAKNIVSIEEQMRELEGALKVCKVCKVIMRTWALLMKTITGKRSARRRRPATSSLRL